MIFRGTWTSSRSRPVWTFLGSTRPRAVSCTWGRATPAINRCWGMKELRAALARKTWEYWWMKIWTWANNDRSQPRKQITSWAASKETWPAGQDRWFCCSLLLWWDPTWSPVSSTGALSTGKMWSCWSGSRGGPQTLSEGWHTSRTRKGRKSWEDGDGLFSRACCDSTRSNSFKRG